MRFSVSLDAWQTKWDMVSMDSLSTEANSKGLRRERLGHTPAECCMAASEAVCTVIWVWLHQVAFNKAHKRPVISLNYKWSPVEVVTSQYAHWSACLVIACTNSSNVGPGACRMLQEMNEACVAFKYLRKCWSNSMMASVNFGFWSEKVNPWYLVISSRPPLGSKSTMHT